MKSEKKYYGLKILAVGSFFILTFQVVEAWVNPPAGPPTDNIGAPVNTSNIHQTKGAGLTLNSSAVSDNGLIVANGNVGTGVISPVQKMEINGNVSATSFLYSSDERKKTGITPIGGREALSKILKLQGVSFNWRDSGRKDLGLIAQAVEKVVPEAVQTGADGYKGVEYGNLNALLIEAIKEQQKEIDELKAICGK